MASLHWASYLGFTSIVEYLLLHPNINLQKNLLTAGKQNALHFAVANGESNHQTLALLLSFPVRIFMYLRLLFTYHRRST